MAVRARVGAALVVAGLACWLVSWAVSTPPGGSPDEPTQYVKAVATATGQLTGAPVQPAAPQPTEATRFIARSTRSFRIDPALVPDGRWACNAFGGKSAACLIDNPPPTPLNHAVRVPSYVATYPPSGYLPYGLAARLASSPAMALRLARLAGAACATLLLGAAAASLRAGLPRAALLAVASPMTLFLAASCNPNGLEAAAGVATAATTLALATGPPSRRSWLLWGACATVLAVSRQFGPVDVVFDVAAGAALLGRSRLRAAVAMSPSAAAGAGAVVSIAVAAMTVWDLAGPQVHPSPAHDLPSTLGSAWRAVWAVRGQLFGVFNWLDVPPPKAATGAALGLYAALVVAALAAGTWRARLVLVGATAGCVAWALAVDALVQLPDGFDMQARYVLAPTAMVLLLAAVAVDERLGGRRLVGWVSLVLGVVLALLGALAWEAAAHGAAVGIAARHNFLASPQWSPTGGWALWVAVTCVGTALAATAGVPWARRQAAVPPPRTTSPS